MLHDALQHGTYHATSMAPHLESPLLEVNKKDEQDKTLLHLATEQGNVPLMQHLIGKGADVNVRDRAGKTPLEYAQESQAVIAQLIGAGAKQELSSAWQATGSYAIANQQLTLIIYAPETQEQGTWHIIETTWSEGLSGQIDSNLVLRYGENRIPLTVDMTILERPPSLQILLQGPDNAYAVTNIGLREACAAQFREKENALTKRTDSVGQYVQATKAACPETLPQATVSDPRVSREKSAQIEMLLGQLTAFQTQYQKDIQAFRINLTVLEQAQRNEQLPTFEIQHNELEQAIARLKSTQVQLRQQCSSAHQALFKTLDSEDQQAIEILLEDPRLDVNAQNEQGIPLLCVATEKWNVQAIRKILTLGGNAGINTIYKDYTPLHKAISKDRLDIVTLMLEKGANVYVYKKHQKGYPNTTKLDASTPLFFFILTRMVKEENFEAQLNILEALLKNGLDPDLEYEILIPIQEFFNHSAGYSINTLREDNQLAENDQYVKDILSPYDDPFCGMGSEMVEKIVDLLEQYGWNWKD